ncbi:MAG TPA: hypothetical protein QGI39_07130, partial [Gammaproteobacteria bacterium]|nr:hypothetical protein [Gammaproteobacteria bacterium]
LSQSRTVAEKFKLYTPVVDIAITSPYERAKQTAAVFSQVFPDLNFEVNELLVPDADAYDVMQIIEQSGIEHLLLVGHNPLMSRLFSLMIDGIAETMRPFGTSNLVCIEMDLVAPGCGEIQYTMES